MTCTHTLPEREIAITADGYCPLCMADEIKRLRAALEPFQRHVDSVSLSGALGHVTREHLWEARHAFEDKP